MKKGNNTLYNLKLYYFPHILNAHKTHKKFFNHFSLKSHKHKYISHYSFLSCVTPHFSKRIIYFNNQLQM